MKRKTQEFPAKVYVTRPYYNDDDLLIGETVGEAVDAAQERPGDEVLVAVYSLQDVTKYALAAYPKPK